MVLILALRNSEQGAELRVCVYHFLEAGFGFLELVLFEVESPLLLEFKNILGEVVEFLDSILAVVFEQGRHFPD